jgi:hypothetical protein
MILKRILLADGLPTGASDHFLIVWTTNDLSLFPPEGYIAG